MGTDSRVEVKPLSRHEGFSSSSSPRNRNLENSELIESLRPLNVPPTSSNEQSSDDDKHAEQAPAGSVRTRIPSSIFGTQPGTPMEWSIASNESLFSIHTGNNSLSKEQFLSLYKSGELTKLDEQIIAQGGVMPSLKELEKMAAAEENAGKGCSGAEETPTTVVETSEVVEDDDDHNKSGIDGSISGLSDESTFSFAFRVR
ncbi:uncharacterized protein LOC120135910 [Hibiscus syriacus]|uniref:uncharacterized protein LOC120135910 n=1 Tax=Hibiscus syriacus TaxID=106335 RepID=UPI001923669D|nr:uncharacterized protein LOC120135910 [Hibiscus syriacus]